MGKRVLELSSSSAGVEKLEKAAKSNPCNQLEIEQENLASQALASELQSLYTSNALSANKTLSIFQKNHHLAGLSLENSMQNTFKLKSATCKLEGKQSQLDLKPAEAKNAARSWQRWMRKKSEWPDLYWADIPMKDPKTEEVFHGQVPFLLPHEWISTYLHQKVPSMRHSLK